LTSVRPSTDRGKTECNMSEETTDITPWVSSRPRTILASMSEWVRKMTTRSVTVFERRDRTTRGESPSFHSCDLCELCVHLRYRRQLVDLQQDHRHVIVLGCIADK